MADENVLSRDAWRQPKVGGYSPSVGTTIATVVRPLERFARMVIEAHLICIALVLVDILARTWRIQWILRGLRFNVPFGEALALNVVGDAASAVTPLRIGGEPARMAALAHARVPLTAGFVAITIEIIMMWPGVFAAGGWVPPIYAPR